MPDIQLPGAGPAGQESKLYLITEALHLQEEDRMACPAMHVYVSRAFSGVPPAHAASQKKSCQLWGLNPRILR
jgi:hypothetical protein